MDQNNNKESMLQKLRGYLVQGMDVMEILMALVIIVAVVVAAFGLYPHMVEFWNNRMSTHALLEFLEIVLNVVIGIELVKMLCKLSAENIIEVLVFLISRHMIIERTSALDDLLAVICIAILFVLSRYMTEKTLLIKKKETEQKNESETDENAQK